MNKKIVGTFIVVLLIMIVIPVSGNIIEISVSNKIDNTINPLINDIWIKTFNKGKYDRGSSVQQTNDGGYIIAGHTSFGAGNYDVLLIKTDSSGNKLWIKTFGGEGDDFASSVQQTSDGGYIITGGTGFYFEGMDVLLLKTDAEGNMIWSKTFGYSIYDLGSEVKQTSDGGFILIGSVNISAGGLSGDIWVIKTDIEGNMVWDKKFDSGGGTSINYDIGDSIDLTLDNGYILLGTTYVRNKTNHNDIWLIKIDQYGNKLWDKTFGGTENEFGRAVQQTNDGGYIILGDDMHRGAWLIKTDATGTILWDKTYQGIMPTSGNSVKQTSDDGYIIAGTIFLGWGIRLKALLIKTDTNGNKIWSNTFGGVISGFATSVQQATDGGYIMTGVKGESRTDVWLIKTDSQGKSKNISSSNLWFEKLVQRFPFFEKILNQIVL